MIITIAAMLIAAPELPAQARCTSFATLPAADKKRYESRYKRRVRTKGKAHADEWIRNSACPEARAAIRARKAAPPLDKNGRPCKRRGQKCVQLAAAAV